MIGWFGRSLANRVAAVVAIVVLLSLASVVSWSSLRQSDALTEQARKGFLMVSTVIANNLVGPVQFRNQEQAQAAYATFAQASDSEIADILIQRDDSDVPLDAFRNQGRSAADVEAAIAALPEDLAVGSVHEVATETHIIYVAVIGKDQNRFGIAAIAWSTEGIDGTVAAAFQEAALIGAVCLVLGVGIIGYVILRVAGRPVGRLTGLMERLAAGDTSVDLPYAGRGDEIGRMAKTVAVFRDQAIRVGELNAERAQREQEAADRRRADLAEVAEHLERQVGEVVEMVQSAVTELSATAGSMSDVATDSSARAAEVAGTVEAAAGDVEAMAGTSRKLLEAVRQVERQIDESRSIGEEAQAVAGSARTTMEGLVERADAISQVVVLINEIAEQTNLLALNATIEAARGRSRKRVRRRRHRGEEPGNPDGQGHHRDRPEDRRDPVGNRRGIGQHHGHRRRRRAAGQHRGQRLGGDGEPERHGGGDRRARRRGG